MENIVREVLKQIPKYLIVFISTLGSPKKCPLQKLQDSKIEPETKLIRALTFLLISYLLVIMLNASNYKGENLYSDLAANGVSIFVYITLLVWAIYFAWKIVGSKLSFYNYLIIYCYHFGVGLFLLSLVVKLSDGVLISLDFDLYQNLVKVKNQEIPFDSTWLESPVYISSLSILIIGFLATTIWNLIGWGAYRDLNESSKWKSFGVLFLVGLISWPIHAINFFIQSALNLK